MSNYASKFDITKRDKFTIIKIVDLTAGDMTSLTVDLSTVEGASHKAILHGAFADPTATVVATFEESDDLTTFNTVDESQIVRNGDNTISGDVTTGLDTMQMSYVGGKRYIRVKSTGSGTVAGSKLFGVFVVSHLRYEGGSNE